MKNNNIIMIIVIAIVVGAVGFFGGMKYQQSKGNANLSRQFPNGMGNRQGATNNQGRTNGGRPVTGDILSLDDKSITVKLQDGSSKIVLIPDSAVITKTDQSAKSDLKIGLRVGVFGTDNTDGSITAQNVQLNPVFRGAGDRPQPSITK